MSFPPVSNGSERPGRAGAFSRVLGVNDIGAEQRLATYGTLGPGRPNHHHLAMIPGAWTTGTVRGHLQQAGWGADFGFPGIVLDDDGPAVAVDLLTSADLPEHWARLDDFEGSGYRRVIGEIDTVDGPIPAYLLYVLAGR